MKYGVRLVAVLVLLVPACSKTTSPLGSGGPPSTAKPGDVRPASDNGKELILASEQLANNYLADARAADANYKDRTVVLTGFVDFVIKDIAGQTVVTLEGAPADGDSTLYVRCTSPMPAWVNQANELKKGQKITVRGKCIGFFVMFVDVMECTFLEVSPAKATQDRASLVKEVEHSVAGIELAPVEFKVDGVDLRMLAPKGATAKSKFIGVVLVRHDKDFAVMVELGRYGFLARKHDKLSGRLVVESDDVMLFRQSRGGFEFSTTVVRGNQEFHLSSESYLDHKLLDLTRAQCLLMLKCAWTLERKK